MSYYEAAHPADADPYERLWLWCVTLHLPNSFNEMLVHLVDPVAGLTKQLEFPAGSDLKDILSWEVRAYTEGAKPWWSSVDILHPDILGLDDWHSGTYNEMLAYLVRCLHAVR